MSLSDCAKCWSTPCECGWDYKDYDAGQLATLICHMVQYRSKDSAIVILEDALDKIMEKENCQGPYISKLSPQEAAKGRSENYYEFSEEKKWEEDKRLGILDWDGK